MATGTATAPRQLSQKEADIQMMLAAEVHLGTKNCDFQMERYVFKRRNDGIYIINLGKTWEKLQMAARVIVAIENPGDIIVQSARPYGQRAVLKFAKYTHAHAIAGRHTPGTFTNQMQTSFNEPRLLILTDPRTDHQPIKEAALGNIPTIAFCDTDSPMRYVDIGIPANNKGKHSIGCLFWLLARMVLQMRGTIRPGHKWDVMVDLFFYREPEETKQAEEEETAAIDYATAEYNTNLTSGDQWPSQIADGGWAGGEVQKPIPGVPYFPEAPAATVPLGGDGWDAVPAPPMAAVTAPPMAAVTAPDVSAHLLLTLTLLIAFTLQFQAHAAPAGPLIKHLTSLLKWTTRSSSKAPQADGNVLQFENGYLVETVIEGNEIGVVPYKIRVSEDGELFAVDEVNSNIVKITPPLSQYSRGRLVAGSFQGYTGHVDGKPNEARFNHPKGVTMDDKGNLYVADTLNLAIRKIGDAGVTTIAGGKSNVAGFRDGPSEDAKFSNDFDVVYVRPTCSLLVIDRGNAALRQISLNQDDCEYQYNSISPTDILMVVGAVLVGYVTCMLQQGFGPFFFSRTQQPSESEFNEETEIKELSNKEKPIPIVESMKEEPGWPSFGQLIIDLSKLALEAMGSMFLNFVPFRFRSSGTKGNLTPLRDTLRMPEDEAAPPVVQRQKSAVPLSETHQVRTPGTGDKYPDMKPPKIKSASFKDSSLSTKHRSSKRQEYAEFYGSGEVPPPYSKSKSQKERTRHRQRDKSGEVVYGVSGMEPKPVEMKPVDYDNLKFDHYNMRSKYGDDSYRF